MVGRKTRHLVFAVALGIGGIIGLSNPVIGDDHGKVRIYKLNNKGQLIQQRWVKNTHEEGCKSSYKRREAHRFAQVGFAYCQIFSENNCLHGSEVPAMWGGRRYRMADIDINEPQIKILKGTRWILAEEKNKTIRSWFCSYTDS